MNIGQHCIMPVGDHLVEVAVRDVRDGEFVLVQTLSPGFGEATMLVRAEILDTTSWTPAHGLIDASAGAAA